MSLSSFSFVRSWLCFSPTNLRSTRKFRSGSGEGKGCRGERNKFGWDVYWYPYSYDEDNGENEAKNAATKTTGRHLSSKDLEPYRYLGDEEVDSILELLSREGRTLQPGQDLLSLARECSEKASKKEINNDDDDDNNLQLSPSELALAKFYNRYNRMPSSVDMERLKLGQRVLVTYLPAISVSLYYRSLVPGFSIPKIAAVLLSTGYLSPPSSSQRVRERLIDTGALLANMCCSDAANTTTTNNNNNIGRSSRTTNNDGAAVSSNCSSTPTDQDDDTGRIQALLPNGSGWKSAIQVRVLHAKVRRALLRRRGERAKWDVEGLGVPINQEDMVATVLAFSANALLGAEMILGWPLPTREREGYLELWRYVGWLMGVPTIHDDIHGNLNSLQPLDPCGPGWLEGRPDSIEHSYDLLTSIIYHNMEPDNTSVKVAHHLLRLGRRDDDEGNKEDRSSGTKHKNMEDDDDDDWFYFRCLRCREFIGDKLADALQLPKHPVRYKRWWQAVKSKIYHWMFRIYTIASLPGSPLRKYITNFHSRRLNAFANSWQTSHLERMGMHILSSAKQDGSENSTRNFKENLPSTGDACCPFAMVYPPSH